MISELLDTTQKDSPQEEVRELSDLEYDHLLVEAVNQKQTELLKLSKEFDRKKHS